jgi:hypothetical protein
MHSSHSFGRIASFDHACLDGCRAPARQPAAISIKLLRGSRWYGRWSGEQRQKFVLKKASYRDYEEEDRNDADDDVFNPVE